MSTHPVPKIIPRPKLALWMFQRGLKLKDAAGPLGVQGEQVRRYCLPFHDPMRVVPPPAVMQRIEAWTLGEVSPADFYEPAEISRSAAVAAINGLGEVHP